MKKYVEYLFADTSKNYSEEIGNKVDITKLRLPKKAYGFRITEERENGDISFTREYFHSSRVEILDREKIREKHRDNMKYFYLLWYMDENNFTKCALTRDGAFIMVYPEDKIL